MDSSGRTEENVSRSSENAVTELNIEECRSDETSQSTDKASDSKPDVNGKSVDHNVNTEMMSDEISQVFDHIDDTDMKSDEISKHVDSIDDTGVKSDEVGQNVDTKEDTESGSFESKEAQQLSKRAQKRLLRREKLKKQSKAKKAQQLTRNSCPGFSSDIFDDTDYYFENGLRKVYPYTFTFSTYAKERWYGRTVMDIFEKEFRVDSPDNFRASVAKDKMRVNGKVVGLDYIFNNGDLLEHEVHRHENPVSDAPIEIVEDTPELIVINKPASIPCHPCGRFRFNSIVFILGKEFGYPNLRNIYRLDRLTSGVLILGKTARKTKELENHVLHRHVHKEYVARVIGEFPEGEIEVDQPLACLAYKLSLWQVQPDGKPSRTTFQRMSYNGKTSLVKCIPHTGRTHQIRVHLQYLGHPIVNDPYYNSPSWGPSRGKGGHCDASYDELCRRIMKEHNVGLWCEGENPLFGKQLPADDQTAQRLTGPPEADVPSHVSHSVSGDHPLSSPEAKRRKLSTDEKSSSIAGSEKLSVNSAGNAQTLAAGSATDRTACSMEGPDKSSDDHLDTQTLVESAESSKEVNSPISAVSDGKRKTDSKDNGGLKAKIVLQKGFEPERWVQDPLCESCRLKYIDPKPHDLLLYLHAFRYKGPSWDYSTRLPEWAREDWVEPPEYDKYFP